MRPPFFIVVTAALLAEMALLAAGVTSPMPYRPGYGLGSFIHPNVIKGMKKEAYARSAIQLAEQMDSAATSLAREVRLASPSANPPGQAGQTIPAPLTQQQSDDYVARATKLRADAWSNKISAYDNLFSNLEAQMSELMQASMGSGEGDVSAFTTFASVAESPVVWEASEIVNLPRASDSFVTGSTFLRVDVVKQKEDISASIEAHSETDGGGFGLMGFGASATKTVSDIAESRYQHTVSTKAVQQTLVLSSFATHRMVRQFKTLTLDADRMRKAWNYYKNTTIHDPSTHAPQFAMEFMQELQAANDTDKLSMISEVFLGSTLVGFVYFIKNEQTNLDVKSASTRNEAKEELNFGMFISSAVHSTKNSKETAKKLAEMASNSDLRIEFDLICLGHIPSMKSRLVQTTVSELKATNVNDQSATVGGAQGQMEKQDNTASVMSGLLNAVNEIVSNNPVLGVETFMDAFDDFAKAAQTRPTEVGAPIGLNVREFTRMDVMGLLADKYLGGRNFTLGGPAASNFKPASAHQNPFNQLN